MMYDDFKVRGFMGKEPSKKLNENEFLNVITVKMGQIIVRTQIELEDARHAFLTGYLPELNFDDEQENRKIDREMQ